MSFSQSLLEIATRCLSISSDDSLLNLIFLVVATPISISVHLKSSDNTYNFYILLLKTFCKVIIASWIVSSSESSYLLSIRFLNCFSRKLIASYSLTPAAMA